MALNAAQVAALRSLGALVTGGALHTGLNVNDARGLAGHAGGRTFDMAPMPDNPNIGAANRLADEMVSEPLNFDAGVVLVLLPVVIIYLVLQRRFIEGVERSGIVG